MKYFACGFLNTGGNAANFLGVPGLVVSNLVVCNFDAEALFGTSLANCGLLRSFALFCGLAFALFCVFLRTTASGNYRNFGNF